MKRIIPKVIEKKENEKIKKPIDFNNVLDNTKKAFVGATAIGLIGIMVHGYGIFDSGLEQGKSQENFNKHLLANGYAAANYDYKALQIRNLIADYNAGIISYEELKEMVQDSNLSELEIDTFVKTHLTEEQYKEYLSLKEDNDNKKRKVVSHGKGALVSACTALVTASATIACSAGLNYKKKRDEKKAQQEARRTRQEKLENAVTKENIDD